MTTLRNLIALLSTDARRDWMNQFDVLDAESGAHYRTNLNGQLCLDGDPVSYDLDELKDFEIKFIEPMSDKWEIWL